MTYDFLVLYQGSTTKLNESEKQRYGATGGIVLHLAKRILPFVGHKLFFYNYFVAHATRPA